MKRIKKTLCAAMVLAMCLMAAIPAFAAVKLSKKSMTLTVGQSKTLKLKGTKKKVKWSSNKKSVATVSSKGKVTAKKAGTAKITAKVGKKKYTCKITVKNKKTSTKGSVSFKSYDTGSDVIIIAKNNYSYNVSINVDCLYYDASGVIVGKTSDSCYCLEPGREYAMYTIGPYDSSYHDVPYETYKISAKVTEAKYYTGNASKIKFTSNFGAENIIVSLKNDGFKNNFTKVAIVFYRGGRAVGYRYTYADVDNPGDEDYIQFNYPYDSDYDIIVPDDYKIYVTSYR